MVNKSTVFQLFITLLSPQRSKKSSFAKVRGIYSCTFNYFRPEDPKPVENAPVTVNFTQNVFESSSEINYSAGGSSALMLRLQKIKFDDQKVLAIDLNPGLILNEEYKYRLKGDSLIITKGSVTRNLYQYRNKLTNA